MVPVIVTISIPSADLSYLYSKPPIKAHHSLGAFMKEALLLKRPFNVNVSSSLSNDLLSLSNLSNILTPTAEPSEVLASSIMSPIHPAQPNECKKRKALASSLIC